MLQNVSFAQKWRSPPPPNVEPKVTPMLQSHGNHWLYMGGHGEHLRSLMQADPTWFLTYSSLYIGRSAV